MIALPPRLAVWLLKRLGSGPQHEALTGDLMERYQKRPSAAWYWWQVLTAIAAGIAYDLRQHYVLAVRAIALSYCMAAVAASATWTVYSFLGLWMWNWTIAHDLDALRVLWFGRSPWGSPLLLAISCVNASMVGWLIARLHRQQVGATLFACVVSTVLYVISTSGSRRMMWPVTFVQIPFVTYVPYFVALIGVPISLLVGGLLGSEPRQEARETVSAP